MAAAADVSDVGSGSQLAFLAPNRQLGGGGGESIFALDLDKIDQKYWICFVGMICFCVLVDRGQAFLDHLAEDSHTNKEFLAKIYTEMLLFGTVAVTVFILTTAAPNLSPNALTLITLTDVLCSMGACSLICLAGITALLRKMYWHNWLHCETSLELERQATKAKMETEKMTAQGTITTTVTVTTRKTFIQLFSASTPESYKLMSSQFLKDLDVPKGFAYHLYLYEIMTRVCCELMSIHWLSWLMLAGFGLACFLVDSIGEKGDGRKVPDYITGVMIVYWGLFLAHSLLSVYVRRTYRSMISQLEAGDVPRSISNQWGARAGWILQIIQLFNSFAVAFYLIHIRHILKKELAAWTPLVLLPLAGNIIWLLPYTLPRIVLVDGFFALDKVALEQVLADMQQAEEDLRYMFDLWIHRGAPDFTSGLQEKMNLSDFKMAMSLLKMHASEARMKRLFNAFDTDQNGHIDMKELTNLLDALHNEAASRENGRARQVSPQQPDKPALKTGMTKLFPKKLRQLDGAFDELKAEHERLKQKVEKLRQDLEGAGKKYTTL
mmetsp:Transcript_86814/g.166007  ORF Transcript_86814/g.166007 Transcript_86814/m.166007 type:complete len:551 (+) Transcript_86814:60-1712(+)